MGNCSDISKPLSCKKQNIISCPRDIQYNEPKKMRLGEKKDWKIVSDLLLCSFYLVLKCNRSL